MCSPVFGEFLLFCFADSLKLCQVGWGASLQSYYQVFPEMFNRVQVRALAGPLKDIQRHSTLLRCFGCVLRVVVLLEGKPSPQSEILSRFSSMISLYFAPFIFPSNLNSLQSLPLKNIPTGWCCHHHASHMGWYWPSDERDAWHPGKIVQYWFHQTRESCFSCSESL